MCELQFVKMHGCGNDYVFIDCFSQAEPNDPHALAIRVSNRHTSIGADGLVLMLPAISADARMRMFNSDGSEGAMCGNALRCFAMWLHQTMASGQTSFRIQMKDRVVEANIVSSDTANRIADVSGNMGPPVPHDTGSGKPEIVAAESGASLVVRQIELPEVHVAEGPAVISSVSMGNPHAVLFVPDLEAIQFESNGRAIEHHSLFPDRTNVEFVQPLGSNHARVRVWERGSGETMACGSGACAVAVAGVSAGVFHDNKPVFVDMRGGQLQVTWRDRKDVLLQGPAVESFRGSLSLNE